MAKIVAFLHLVWVFSCTNNPVNPPQPHKLSSRATEPIEIVHKEHFKIKENSTVYSELKKVGLPSKEIFALIEASKFYHPLNKVAANTPFVVTWSDQSKTEIIELEFKLSPVKRLVLEQTQDQWLAKSIELPVIKEDRTFTGIVETSLWESAALSGMEPELIVELTEIFAWQIDFSREVRKGDKWRLVVEEKIVEGKSIGWGYILAAQYSNDGETYTGIRFPADDPMASYYQEDGTSLRRMFLKSPLKFGRVSSGFSRRRFHPILKTNRPHLGVDYAAPTGTPVRAVGDGKVIFAARNGGSGKMIKIRHNSIYSTAYLHLNGYAKGIRKGASVKQGQNIGYVGSTGLATGPHLHFSFYKRGRYVDPLRMKFPSSKPVAATDFGEFQLLASGFIGKLPQWQVAAIEDRSNPFYQDSFN